VKEKCGEEKAAATEEGGSTKKGGKKTNSKTLGTGKVGGGQEPRKKPTILIFQLKSRKMDKKEWSTEKKTQKSYQKPGTEHKKPRGIVLWATSQTVV